jgi:hypothetical protein
MSRAQSQTRGAPPVTRSQSRAANPAPPDIDLGDETIQFPGGFTQQQEQPSPQPTLSHPIPERIIRHPFLPTNPQTEARDQLEADEVEDITQVIVEQAAEVDQQDEANQPTITQTRNTQMENIALTIRSGLVATRNRTLTEINKALTAIDSCEKQLENHQKLLDNAVKLSENAQNNSYIAAERVKKLEGTLIKTDTRLNDMIELLKETRSSILTQQGTIPGLTEVVTALEQRITDLTNSFEWHSQKGQPQGTQQEERRIPEIIPIDETIETPKFRGRTETTRKQTDPSMPFPVDSSIRFESTRVQEEARGKSPDDISRRTSPSPAPIRTRRETKREDKSIPLSVNQTTATGASIPKEARAKRPEPFSGRKGREAENFIMRMNIYFNDFEEGTFNDQRKMIAMLTNMKEGEASSWALPLLQRLTTGKTHEFTSSWKSLQDQFILTFSDPIKKDKAIRKLQKLEQTKSAQEYATQFRILIQEVDWDQAALIDQFKHGLKPEVKQELQRIIMYANGASMTLEECIDVACKADDLLYTNKTLNTQSRPYQNNPSKWSKPNANATNKGNTPLSKGKEMIKVPDAEKDRRRREKLCIKCGKAGHQVKECRGNWTYENKKVQGKAAIEAESDSESEN